MSNHSWQSFTVTFFAASTKPSTSLSLSLVYPLRTSILVWAQFFSQQFNSWYSEQIHKHCGNSSEFNVLAIHHSICRLDTLYSETFDMHNRNVVDRQFVTSVKAGLQRI
ncbi:hypothetical protein BDF20DRAFT_835844 [Mycotypha africana]|uniref:uncharacterized protein n=1 Tax=Mycotypha africana TaxID=64632 RepID=UPI0022FFC8D4|nr:uncharacterized protein BDF20DRAFT_835844 [Mycotypha africana]KAI8977010.1 hypothetical protein BDF20DRAFT_835844 [Mycotypha africana]